MLTANCDSTFFRFVITVFPKDYEKYAPMLESGKIVMADGSLKFNEQMNEISVMPDLVRITTLTSLRNQVIELGMYDEKDKVNYLSDLEDVIEAVKESEKVEKPKIPALPEEYVVSLPSTV